LVTVIAAETTSQRESRETISHCPSVFLRITPYLPYGDLSALRDAIADVPVF